MFHPSLANTDYDPDRLLRQHEGAESVPSVKEGIANIFYFPLDYGNAWAHSHGSFMSLQARSMERERYDVSMYDMH
jgi:hypothetical protein